MITPNDESQFDVIAPLFLGPRAENAELWDRFISYIFRDYVNWRRNYFPSDPIIITHELRHNDKLQDDISNKLDVLLNQLKSHFPFYSPRYIAHMLSEQTLPGVLGYFAGMLYNPNNVTDEAAPVTVRLELEVGRMISEMLGYKPKTAWAHICSGGTIANIEAFWAARTVQFIPLMVKEYCLLHSLQFSVKMPNGTTHLITNCSDINLVGLNPRISVQLIQKLLQFLTHDLDRIPEHVAKDLNNHIQESKFNIRRRGLYSVLRDLKIKPRIFVSQSAHYSINKAANILGYGEDSVQAIDIDSHFRMDVDSLKKILYNLADDEYIAAVVGIVGTTEEGAVDPIHEIKFLRDKLESERNRSFWFHVDAAWGGYFKSMFRDCGLPRTAGKGKNIEGLAEEYCQKINASRMITIETGTGEAKKNVAWKDGQVIASFIALKSADSVTIDPHKMGYIPYPCGVIAFRNRQAIELLKQRAQYISETSEEINPSQQCPEIQEIGPYIIEGSKPGAAAAAAWLAHTVIPLNLSGHGLIVRETLIDIFLK
jgi:glutamate/tyrosine decarboxylase-like PLP-dependent enzyme